MSNDIDSPVQTCSNPGGKKIEPPPPPTNKYIGVKVADGDKKPMANVILTIELPDEEYFEPSTDENGESKYYLNESGACTLHIDWRSLLLENVPLNKMLLIQ
jgi:hypothetical protein